MVISMFATRMLIFILVVKLKEGCLQGKAVAGIEEDLTPAKSLEARPDGFLLTASDSSTVRPSSYKISGTAESVATQDVQKDT